MNKLFYILILALAFNGCKKADIDSRDLYVGNWNFEVIYSSIMNDQINETVVHCQGKIEKGTGLSSLALQHSINDYLNITVNNEGVVHDHEQKLMGIIDHETCLIVDNSPKESSIDKITIKGVR
jgi:hypothetical protein